MTTTRAADLLVQGLSTAGVQHLFALSGNQIMPVFDACIGTPLHLIHVRHEAATVHMADAWARLTGHVGVALVTAGPGFANALAPLYTALAAEAPVVLLAGQAPVNQLGRGAFQEMPQAEMARGVTKAAWAVAQAEHIDQDLARAITIAASGRPGPVYLGLPFDVLQASLGEKPANPIQARDFQHQEQPLDAELTDTVLQQLGNAQRPLILTGPALLQGSAPDLIRELQTRLQIPVIGMASPRGSNDPSLGQLASVLARADKVLLLGKALDFTLRFGQIFNPQCQFLQIDPEPQVIERTRRNLDRAERLLLAATADAYPSARRLLGRSSKVREYRAWLSQVQAALAYRPAAWQSINTSAGPLHPVEVCRAVQTLLARQQRAIMISDGGEFSQWAQACLASPDPGPKVTRLINGPAGAIGSALPAALAAKLAEPEATVVALLGDGTFGFHMAEFDTAVRYQLPFIAVVGNDACWNAEYQIQLAHYGPERLLGCELLPSRYDQVVTALGGHGEYVTRSDQLAGALQRALASGKPACVNVALQRQPAPVVKT